MPPGFTVPVRVADVAVMEVAGPVVALSVPPWPWGPPAEVCGPPGPPSGAARGAAEPPVQPVVMVCSAKFWEEVVHQAEYWALPFR